MKARFRRLIASLFERQVRRVVRRHHLTVVAVAGSVGKTSTKGAIATVVAQKYRVLAGHRNYNSEIGLPLSVFELEVPAVLFNPFAWAYKLAQSEYRLHHYPYQALVLELGTDHPGEIPLYTRYLQPDLGVITAVTPEHMAGFPGGLDQVAAEELALAPASKHVVANADEILAKYRHKYLDPHPSHTYYGANLDAGYSFKIAKTSPTEGTTLTIKRDGKAVAKDVHLASFGPVPAKFATAAFAVGQHLGLTDKQLAAGLAKIRPVSGRMNPLAGLEGATLIDDTYNSSPEAALAALEALLATPVGKTGRHIAILGSMNELGADSPTYHEQVGAAAAGVDWLITVGADAGDYLGPAAVKAGLDPSRFKSADSPYAAGRFVRTMLVPGDIVLIKGSQNHIFTEEATKVLLANPADAAQLVRQSPAWMRLKQQQFSDAEN